MRTAGWCCLRTTPIVANFHLHTSSQYPCFISLPCISHLLKPPPRQWASSPTSSLCCRVNLWETNAWIRQKAKKLCQLNENCLGDKIVNGVRHEHGQIKRTEDKINRVHVQVQVQVNQKMTLHEVQVQVQGTSASHIGTEYMYRYKCKWIKKRHYMRYRYKCKVQVQVT